ncbi:hypothetical protein H4S14_000765 [Agrobacterium vitis]|nr:hypothetical protein [Agrobacterium vitis]MBE1437038.1 hypothetical protein [Agrobacterium vitis]
MIQKNPGLNIRPGLVILSNFDLITRNQSEIDRNISIS